MLRESYMASMWLAHGYVNSSPAHLDRLRRQAEETVLTWVSDHEPTPVPAQIACTKVLDSDRVEVDVSIVDRIRRFLYTLSENRIDRLPPLNAAAR